jgi:hypothetical protein
LLIRRPPEKINLFLKQGGFQGIAERELGKARKQDRRESIATVNNIIQAVFALVSVAAIVLAYINANEVKDLKRQLKHQQLLIQQLSKPHLQVHVQPKSQ